MGHEELEDVTASEFSHPPSRTKRRVHRVTLREIKTMYQSQGRRCPIDQRTIAPIRKYLFQEGEGLEIQIS